MANTYKIQFESDILVAENDFSLKFDILDEDDNKISGLNLTSNAGEVSEVQGGSYDYEVVVTDPGEAPASMKKEVKIYLNDEDINTYLNTAYEYYIPDPCDVTLYTGDSKTFSYLIGTVAVTNIADSNIASADGAIITAESNGSTNFSLTYDLDGSNIITVVNIINVESPSVTTPSISERSDESAKLTATSEPSGVDIYFRYGESDSFDPVDSTTYTEVKSTDGTITITGLLSNTRYACQSVINYNGVYYTNPNAVPYTTFRTKIDRSTSRVGFNPESASIISASVNTPTSIAATIDKSDAADVVIWSFISDLDIEIIPNSSDDSISTIMINWPSTKLVDDFSSDKLKFRSTIIAKEFDANGNMIGTHSGKFNIDVYNVITRLSLLLRGSNSQSKSIKLNKELTYKSITVGSGSGTLYNLVTELDDDSNIISAVIEPLSEGSDTLSIVVSNGLNNFTFNLNINIMATITFPPVGGLNAEDIKVFSSASEMFHSYPGVEYSIQEDNDQNYYLFRTNDPSEDVWEYDTCILAPEYIANQTAIEGTNGTDGE